MAVAAVSKDSHNNSKEENNEEGNVAATGTGSGFYETC